jgi:hypothetical protein
MMMRENESDIRFIRYIISVPDGIDMSDRAILKKIEIIQNEISQNITKESLTHLTTDIGDVLALSKEGYGIQSMTKKLQNILNKRKIDEKRLDMDLASDIMSNRPVSTSEVLHICAIEEHKSKVDLFFKLCHDLCKNRVSGALAKRHGVIEEVEHVTSIRELWCPATRQVEILFTYENNTINQEEVTKNIPSYDYLTKQLSPKNEYVHKSERFYSNLQFKLAMSGRSNHVKHPDFNYTQVFHIFKICLYSTFYLSNIYFYCNIFILIGDERISKTI